MHAVSPAASSCIYRRTSSMHPYRCSRYSLAASSTQRRHYASYGKENLKQSSKVHVRTGHDWLYYKRQLFTSFCQQSSKNVNLFWQGSIDKIEIVPRVQDPKSRFASLIFINYMLLEHILFFGSLYICDFPLKKQNVLSSKEKSSTSLDLKYYRKLKYFINIFLSLNLCVRNEYIQHIKDMDCPSDEFPFIFISCFQVSALQTTNPKG